jgi:hypothetical protein
MFFPFSDSIDLCGEAEEAERVLLRPSSKNHTHQGKQVQLCAVLAWQQRDLKDAEMTVKP